MAKVATKSLDLEKGTVEFVFEGSDPIIVALKDFTEETQLHAALHGLSQKLGDSYASAKGVVADAKAMFEAVLHQLKNGDWRAARGEGEAKPRTTELAMAIARIQNKGVEEVAANLLKATEDQLKTLRSNERVKAVIQVLRAEKAAIKLAKLDESGEDDLNI
jgi:tRNA(Ile2) C34 agmatinyltransferase TiaS